MGFWSGIVCKEVSESVNRYLLRAYYMSGSVLSLQEWE